MDNINTPPTRRSHLLFDLGPMQVFHVSDTEQVPIAGQAEVYWQDMRSKTVYGPFISVYYAMQHYTYTSQKPPEVLPDNVIKVDFKLRKRV